MKIIAIERDVDGIENGAFREHSKAEAKEVCDLQQENIIREIYFRADKTNAVLVLECESVEQAKLVLSELPFVENNLIQFELIPLAPYPGFERLFEN